MATATTLTAIPTLTSVVWAVPYSLSGTFTSRAIETDTYVAITVTATPLPVLPTNIQYPGPTMNGQVSFGPLTNDNFALAQECCGAGNPITFSWPQTLENSKPNPEGYCRDSPENPQPRIVACFKRHSDVFTELGQSSGGYPDVSSTTSASSPTSTTKGNAAPNMRQDGTVATKAGLASALVAVVSLLFGSGMLVV